MFAVSIANASGGNAAISVQFYDGSTEVIIAAATVSNGSQDAITLPYPLILTNSLYLRIVSDVNVTISAAYQNTVRGS